jgi:hypothetical protein
MNWGSDDSKNVAFPYVPNNTDFSCIQWKLSTEKQDQNSEILGSYGESLRMAVSWKYAPCSLVEIDRSFIRVYRLHHQGDNYLLA